MLDKDAILALTLVVLVSFAMYGFFSAMRDFGFHP